MRARATSALLFSIIGAVAYLWLIPATVDVMQANGFSPVSFPRAVAGVVAVASLAELLFLFYRRYREGRSSHPETVSTGWLKDEFRTSAVFVGLIAYWLLLDAFGYWAATVPALIAFMWIYGARQWVAIVLRAAIGAGVIFALVEWLLPLSLP